MSFMDFLSNLAVWLVLLAPLIEFIVFLVLAIVFWRKVKKTNENRNIAVIFTILCGFNFLLLAVEVTFLIILAAGVAHM